jgi:hypothetical protein
LHVVFADTIKPIINLCGVLHETVEAGMAYTLCTGSTASDNSDGDITNKIVVETFHDHHKWPSNGIEDCPPPCTYGPHNLGMTPGVWTFKYVVADSSGNNAIGSRVVIVKDTIVPRITILGSDTVVHECGTPYTDAGATAKDNLDGDFAPRVYGTTTRRSCMDVRAFEPLALSGTYTIQYAEINGGEPLEVECDMDTDGGGYTYYRVDNGHSTHFLETNQFNPENFNQCQTLGLQMAIWRSETHQIKMLTAFGAHYFQVAPGIIGTSLAENTNLKDYAMNSKTRDIGQYYKAIDDGHWFIRDTPFAEPNGDYQQGCYLGMFGYNPSRFNDDECNYQTGSHYVCSTNDKGGVGMLPELGQASSDYPPVNDPGEYFFVYRAADSAGNEARPRTRKVIVVDTIPPPVTLKADSNNEVFEQRFIYKTELYTMAGERHTTGAWAGVCPYGVICTGTPGVDESLSVEDPGADCMDKCDGLDTYVPGDWVNVFSFVEAGVYRKRYGCNDTSGNFGYAERAWTVIDDYAPRIDMNGDAIIQIEPFPNSTYTELGARCTDKQDCPKNSDGTDNYCLDDVLKINIPTPIDPTTPGDYYVYFECEDSDGMNAPETFRIIRVKDTICPRAKLLGAEKTIMEAGFQYIDPVPPAEAFDINCNCSITHPIEKNGLTFGGFSDGGNTVDISRAYYTRGSCLEIKKDMDIDCSKNTKLGVPCDPMPNGEYYITTRPNGAMKKYWEEQSPPQSVIRLKVWCDFAADGGGYTSLDITGGIHTDKAFQNNSCTEVGLQMVVPRTEWHFAFLANKFGKDYLNAVPGIYGLAAGNYMQWAMNSAGGVEINANWKSIDAGPWFIRSSTFQYPSGQYTPYCWLGMDDWWHAYSETNGVTEFSFLDSYCDFGVTNYICSTNDKGGMPGVEPGPDRYVIKNNVGPIDHYPPGAEAGKYIVEYHVQDWGGNFECSTPKRTIVVRDTMAPRIFLWNAAGSLLKRTDPTNIRVRNNYGHQNVSSITNTNNNEKWENFKDLNEYQEKRFAANYNSLLNQIHGPQNPNGGFALMEEKRSGWTRRALMSMCAAGVGVLVLAVVRQGSANHERGYATIEDREDLL